VLNTNLGPPDQRIETMTIKQAVAMFVVSRCAQPTIANWSRCVTQREIKCTLIVERIEIKSFITRCHRQEVHMVIVKTRDERCAVRIDDTGFP
jgi:hypothetical protein